MRENPYRLFFPLSWLGAFALALVWIPAVLIERHIWTIPGWNAYPRDLHSTLAAGVFVLPAMTGFLLTAAPRMTGSSPASMIWVGALFFCEILIPPSILLGGTAIVLVVACATLSAFLIVTARRAENVPSYFWIIVSGTLSGVLGAIFWVLFPAERIGANILFYAMFPQILLGASTMLVVPISGSAKRMEWRVKMLNIPLFEAAGLAGLFWISNALYLLSVTGAGLPAAIASTVWILTRVHAVTPGEFHGILAKMFWTASSLFCIGLIGRAFPWEFSVHAAHVYWIGGLVMFLLAVSVQVLLSHGGHAMNPLPSRRTLVALLILVLLTVVTRVSAPLVPAMYISHLSYAAFVFLIVWILWLVRFARFLGSAKS